MARPDPSHDTLQNLILQSATLSLGAREPPLTHIGPLTDTIDQANVGQQAGCVPGDAGKGQENEHAPDPAQLGDGVGE